VQEIALVVANSTHDDLGHELHDDPSVRTTGSCGAYDVTAKATLQYDGLTETYTAAYTLLPMWTAPADGGGLESFFSTDNTSSMSGSSSWTISGVSQTTGCTWSGHSTSPVGPGMHQATLKTRDFGKGDPRTTYEFGFATPFHIAQVTKSCPNGHVDTGPHQVGHGFQSEPKPYDPENQSIVGAQTETQSWLTTKREWQLTRKEIGPDAP
jgi:hypothetical protein